MDAYDLLLGGCAPAPTARSEKAILNDILVDVSAEPETLVYRNNTGMAWQGERVTAPVGSVVKIEPGMIILREGRPLHAGLPGSGDIMGVSRGRPLSLEVKRLGGRQTEIQRNFERAWTRAGGLYVLARSSAEALALLKS